MPAPIPAGGNLVGAVAAPLSIQTFTGTASAADYITVSNPTNNSLFADIVQRDNTLIFTVAEPFANKTGVYTLPMLGTANAIEYISSDSG